MHIIIQNAFINDLIYKCEISKNIQYISNINETVDDNDIEEQPIAKDAGTLFREAYFNRKVNKTNVKKDDVEMQNIKLIGGNGIDNNDNDDLV